MFHSFSLSLFVHVSIQILELINGIEIVKLLLLKIKLKQLLSLFHSFAQMTLYLFYTKTGVRICIIMYYMCVCVYICFLFLRVKKKIEIDTINYNSM